MDNQKDKDIQDLVNRITALELDNLQLKKEIKDLKNSKKKAKESEFIKDEYARAKKQIFLNKNCTPIKLGDKVYIVTAGAHTNKLRRGTITGFDEYRNRVFILDSSGITQERAPKNVRIKLKRNQA